MASTAEHSEEPRRQRSKNRDALGMSSENLFRKLHHHLQAFGLLECRSATNDGDDCEHHRDRWLTWCKPEGEDHKQQADTGNEAKTDAAVSGAKEQGSQDDDDLKNDGQNGIWCDEAS